MCDAKLPAARVSVGSAIPTARLAASADSTSENEAPANLRFSLKGLMLFTTLTAVAFAIVRKDVTFGIILGVTTIPAIMSVWREASKMRQEGRALEYRQLFLHLCQSVLINAFIGAAACLAFGVGEMFGWMFVMLGNGGGAAAEVGCHIVGVMFAASVIFIGFRYRSQFISRQRYGI